ncbi:MAG TPA: hypothetical protein VFE24_17295 [Pirellulales bacterium]|jgi:hypothetical protein|nr:hypothetical protein [Pirellulales bacterium]
MQTVIYVLAKPNQQSLREYVVRDFKTYEFDGYWNVILEHKKGRVKGWAKIERTDCYGSLNIEWDADAKTLIGRAVTRKGHHPNELVGHFVSYLLRWQRKRISSIVVRTI